MRKVSFFFGLMILAGSLWSVAASAGELQVIVEGLSNNERDGPQADYAEAVRDAKIKAIQRAGVAIRSSTKVDKGVLEEDLIEAESKGVLLPGYQVIKVGYGQDGAYHVVLVGRIRIGTDDLKRAISGKAEKGSYAFIVKEGSHIRKIEDLRGAVVATDSQGLRLIKEQTGISFFLNEIGIHRFEPVDTLDYALRLLQYDTAHALISTSGNCLQILSQKNGFRGLEP